MFGTTRTITFPKADCKKKVNSIVDLFFISVPLCHLLIQRINSPKGSFEREGIPSEVVKSFFTLRIIS